MSKNVKIILLCISASVLCLLIFYCVRFGSQPQVSDSTENSAADTVQTADLLVKQAESALKSGNAKRIVLSDNGSTASSADVLISGNTVTVNSGGIYSVSGSLSDGTLAVDCGDAVTLILDNAEITSLSGAAINVLNAEHTLIYLPANSDSKLISGAQTEITPKTDDTDADSAAGAALYARDDLSISGGGRLFAGGYINNAVATTDNLQVLGGELVLEAVNNGLKGKDSVTVTGGNISIKSGNDGIKANNTADADCGNVYIRGGEINIISLGDGIQAENKLTVEDGNITVAAGETAENAERDETDNGGEFIANGNEFMPGGEAPAEIPGNADFGGMPQGEAGELPENRGEMMQATGTPPEMPDGSENAGFGVMPDNNGKRGFGNRGGAQFGSFENEGGKGGKSPDIFNSESSTDSGDGSAKGIKSGGDLTVSGGTVTVNSVDDCIHSDSSINITGGILNLTSSDDGVHAEQNLTVSGGEITVSDSYEGLEGTYIYIDGGTVDITAADDGINASGGSFGRPGAADTGSSSLPLLKISGGTLYVNADGDGLDSNGDLFIEGGTVVVDGPQNSGNGALDSGSENGGSILCNGGTVIAIGASGMAETFESGSAQSSFIKNYSAMLQAGTNIVITDESGNILFEHTAAKSFNSVVFSCPELTAGGTYTLTVGTQSDTVTV